MWEKCTKWNICDVCVREQLKPVFPPNKAFTYFPQVDHLCNLPSFGFDGQIYSNHERQVPEVDRVAVILEAFLFLPHEIVVTVNRDGFLYQPTALWASSVPPQKRILKRLTTLSFSKCHRPQRLRRPCRRSCPRPVYRSDCLRLSLCERCS